MIWKDWRLQNLVDSGGLAENRRSTGLIAGSLLVAILTLLLAPQSAAPQ